MTILDHTRALRVFTETRDRLRANQERLLVENVEAGQAVADAIDVLDDAIVQELRELRQSEAERSREPGALIGATMTRKSPSPATWGNSERGQPGETGNSST
ncbi:MAG TPA: hypothetical protein VFZ98_07480 [Vicinamibacterales bacterium]